MIAVTAHAYCTDVLYCGLGVTAENDPSGCLSYVRDGVRVAELETRSVSVRYVTMLIRQNRKGRTSLTTPAIDERLAGISKEQVPSKHGVDGSRALTPLRRAAPKRAVCKESQGLMVCLQGRWIPCRGVCCLRFLGVS